MDMPNARLFPHPGPDRHPPFAGSPPSDGLPKPAARPMSKFNLWSPNSYIQSGLLTAASAMLAPMLFAFPATGRKEDLAGASMLVGIPAM